MRRNKCTIFAIISVLLITTSLSVYAAPPRQDEGRLYIIQEEEWLSTIAEREYGTVLAYRAIYYYSNLKAAEDERITFIANPNIVDSGWTIYLPSTEDVEAFLFSDLDLAVEAEIATLTLTAEDESVTENDSTSQGNAIGAIVEPPFDTSSITNTQAIAVEDTDSIDTTTLETTDSTLVEGQTNEAKTNVAYNEEPSDQVILDSNDTLHLAYLLTLSGDTAFLGEESLAAVEMAIAEHGQLLGHDIVLTGADALCSVEGGQAAASTLIADTTIIAIIGTNCFASATTALPILSEAGLLIVSPSNTGPALTSPDALWQPGYFRTAHNDLLQPWLAANYAYTELGLRRVALVHYDEPYTKLLQETFAQVFEVLGGQVVYQGIIDVGEKDMTPILSAIADQNPDLIYLPIFEPEGPHFVSQVAAVPRLEDIVLFGADGLLVPTFPPAAGALAEGMYLSGIHIAGNAYEVFAADYETKTGDAPLTGFAAHSYDATRLILEAIKIAAVEKPDGTLQISRQALRNAITRITAFNGLTGQLTCDAFGDCATGEALGIYQITSAQIKTGDWPPPLVYTATRQIETPANSPE